MRPAGKAPLDSLYFNYPRFPVRHVPELDSVGVQHPVVIVGAGPIGMTAALVLARYGVRCVLIDRKDTFNDGSRAICIARPSMHILERAGAVAPFVKKALGWRFGRSYYRAGKSSGPKCLIRRARSTCRCTIFSSNTSSSFCMMRSAAAS